MLLSFVTPFMPEINRLPAVFIIADIFFIIFNTIIGLCQAYWLYGSVKEKENENHKLSLQNAYILSLLSVPFTCIPIFIGLMTYGDELE